MNDEYKTVKIQDLRDIADYLPYFMEKDTYGTWEGGEKSEGVFVMPHVIYSKEVTAFLKLLYDSGFIISFDWSAWKEGKILTAKREKLHNVDLLTLRKLITAIVRNDRFCEGAFLSAIENGLVADILQRLHELLNSNDIKNNHASGQLPIVDKKHS